MYRAVGEFLGMEIVIIFVPLKVFQKNISTMRKVVSPEDQPIFSYLYESVRTDHIQRKKPKSNLQGPLCDFSVFSMEGDHVNCHLLVIGTLSPYVLNLVKDVEGDCLILPDFSKSDILSFMNLAYTGK